MSDESNETTSEDELADAETETEVGLETDADLEAAAAAAEPDADAETDTELAAAETDAAEVDAPSDRKAKADAAIAARTVNRRTVTSRRVTPKGGVKPKDVPAEPVQSKARDAKKTESVVSRTTSSPAFQQTYSKGPSPWYVPAIMFGLLILGGLLIMANYMGVFGDPSNIRLVIGLGLILGGIVTATQYR